jgi:DNA-binding NtrC family response regulator
VPPISIDGETMAALKKYSWPGNVRELDDELKKAVAYDFREIGIENFSPHIQYAAQPPRPPVTDIRQAVGALETELITRTLSDTNWNKSQTARILGLSRLGLQKKIDRYGLDRRR